MPTALLSTLPHLLPRPDFLSASMASLQAIEAFIGMLAGLPPAALPAGRIGLARPADTSALPCIVVSVARARESVVGLGRLVQLAQPEPGRWATTSGSRMRGELQLELWGVDAAAVTSLADAVLARTSAQANALRSAGFIDLSLTSLGPAQPLRAGAADAQMLPLVFAAVFEHLVTPPPGGEGVISTVHVDLLGEVDESMDIR